MKTVIVAFMLLFNYILLPLLHFCTIPLPGRVTHGQVVRAGVAVTWFDFDLICVVVMTPGLSKTFSVMYDHPFSKLANHQIRHYATPKVGCQPCDCIWSLQFSSGFFVGMYELTYALYHPRGAQWHEVHCYDLDVLGSNPSWVKSGVCSTSV